MSAAPVRFDARMVIILSGSLTLHGMTATLRPHAILAGRTEEDYWKHGKHADQELTVLVAHPVQCHVVNVVRGGEPC